MQEISRPGFDHMLAIRSGLQPHLALDDVQRRFVIAVVVPAGYDAGIGIDGATPHALLLQGDPAAHAGRRVSSIEIGVGYQSAWLGTIVIICHTSQDSVSLLIGQVRAIATRRM